MTDSQYPNALDDDRQLIRVDDNITEIGGDAINGLRSAVFNIEQALGVNPQGTATDVVARLNQSLNPDGTIKASALSAIGLVTLPITNSMVASNAGILESKLDLNYSTKILRELIGALRVEHDALVLTVQGDITNLSRHVAHPTTFGRHRTSDIDGYIGKYAGYDLQGIIDDLDTRIVDHLSDPIDVHDASAISFDDTDTFINADEVQTAIEKLDALGIATLTMHQDTQHSNGILSSQKVYSPNTYHGVEVVPSSVLNTVSAGAVSVTFVTPPSELSQVIRGDRVDITIDSNVYTRNIESVDASSGIVYFFVALPVGGINPTAVIYRSSEESSIPSSLNLSIRHDTISGNLGGSLLQLIHPSSPYILSNGLDVRAFSATAKNIKIAWADGVTGDIDAYQALQTYPAPNATPSVWTPENLVIALNEEFKKDANNYPLVAFTYKGEVGIAFDEPDGYVEFRAPSSNSAWSAFGLSGTEISYAISPRRFYLDGYDFSEIRKIVDATATTDNSTVIKNISVDLTSLGIGQTGIVRVKNHTDAGTYVFNASSSNSLTISSHVGGFAADTSVNIEIYADSFAVPIDTGIHTLFELFVDGYGHDYGELRGAARVGYTIGGGSTANPQEWFDIIEISRNFATGTKRINFQDVGGDKIVKLGTPVTSPPTSTDVTSPGESYTLPTTNVIGHRFRLYDYNNVDYVDIEIVSNAYTGVASDQAIDLSIYGRISEEKYIQIGQVLHDTVRFKHLSDRRLIGTVGRKDIRNDYSRDYISYPRSLLRGNGVVYGCQVAGSVVVGGGQVLVDGNIYSIDVTNLTVPSDGVSSTYNVFVDSDGIVRFLKNDQEGAAGFATPSVEEIVASSDKTILAQVDVDASGSVTEIRDFRRFVNNIDNKVDLIVEENDIVYGSFASLKSVVNYINEMPDPSAKIIKIRGTVLYDVSSGRLDLPAGTKILGDGSGVDASTGSTILLQGTSTDMFLNANLGGCSLENITIECDSGASVYYIISGYASGVEAPVPGIVIENCVFKNINAQAIVSGFVGTALDKCRISNSSIDFVSSASLQSVVSASGNADEITIENCDITFGSSLSNYIVNVYQYASTGGDLSNCYLSHVNVDFPSSTNIYGVFANNDITGCRMLWCNLTNTSLAGSAVRSATSPIVECTISNCRFEKFNYIVNGSSATNVVVENSIIKEIGQQIWSMPAANSYFRHNSVEITSYITVAGPPYGIIYMSTASNVLITDNMISLAGTNVPVFDFGASDSVYVNKNIIRSSSTISKAIEFGSTAEDVYVTGNIFDLTGTSDDIIEFTGQAANVFISDNSIITTSTIVNGIDFVAAAEDIYVINNTYDLGGQAGFIVDFSGATTNAHVENNVINSSSYIDTCIIVGSNSENIVLNGNILNASSVATGEWLIASGDVQGLSIINNMITVNGTQSNAHLFYAGSTLTDLLMTGNVVISNATLGSGDFVYFATVTTGFFHNNVFDFAAGASEAILRMDSATGVVISKNMFKSTSTGTATGYMIHVENTSSNVSIVDNMFVNTVTAGKGFARAINFVGGGGTDAGDHIQTVISNNIITNFSSSSKGIYINNGNSIKISGNSIGGDTGSGGGSEDPIHIDNTIYVIIERNHLFSSVDRVILIEGTNISSFSEGIYKIHNNILHQFSATPTELIEITNDVPRVGTIDGNTIIHMVLLPGVYANSLINIGTSHNWYIVNNMFHTSWLGSPVIYSIAPITTGGDNTVVSFNHMRRVSSSATTGLVNNTGSDGVDYMNWGQTYTVGIPNGHGSQIRSNAGAASWYNNTSSGYWELTNGTYNSSYGRLYIPFGSEIPNNATISKITIYYALHGSGASGQRSNITFGLKAKLTRDMYSIGLYQSANPSSTTTGYTDITSDDLVPASPITHNSQTTYWFEVWLGGNSGTWELNIWGVDVVYTM